MALGLRRGDGCRRGDDLTRGYSGRQGQDGQGLRVLAPGVVSFRRCDPLGVPRVALR
jgi:hypothetical protein